MKMCNVGSFVLGGFRVSGMEVGLGVFALDYCGLEIYIYNSDYYMLIRLARSLITHPNSIPIISTSPKFSFSQKPSHKPQKQKQSYQKQLRQRLKQGSKQKQKQKQKQDDKQKQAQQIGAQVSKTRQMLQQAQNLEVASQSIISEQLIIDTIKEQRKQIFYTVQSSSQSQSQLRQKQLEKNLSSEDLLEELFRQKSINSVKRLLVGVTGVNVGVGGVLAIMGKLGWIGVWSCGVLYPSLLFTSCAAIGINLAYMVTRQTLCMYIKSEDLKTVDLTYSPLSYYIQSFLLTIQVFSLSAAVSMPITLLKLSPSLQTTSLYSLLACMLAVNAHSTFQQKQIKNKAYRISVHSTCFAIMFLLSAYIHYRYSLTEATTPQAEEEKKVFQEGQNRVRQMWKIKRVTIQDSKAKITDILEKEDMTKTNSTSKNEVSNEESSKKKQGKIF